MKGTALWTALPNGYTENGQPRVSVLVAPRFDDLTVADPLGPFGDWPRAIGLGKLKFTLQVDGGASFSNLEPLYFREQHWNNAEWVSQASARWKAAFRNYLGQASARDTTAHMTSLGQRYQPKTYDGILPSTYQSRTLSEFARRLFQRQNNAVSLVKRPSQLGRVAEIARNIAATTALVSSLNVRLAVNASEQQKLESFHALKRFNEWVPDRADMRTAASALKSETLASLSAYDTMGDPTAVGTDLQAWVLDAAIISIAKQLGLSPPASGRALLDAASRANQLDESSVPYPELAGFAQFHAQNEKRAAINQRSESGGLPQSADIHAAFTSLADFPQLERALGIVVDLELPQGTALPMTGVMSVLPQWNSPPSGMLECVMKTQFTANAAQKRFFVTPATPYLDQGFVDLRKSAFQLETLDVDSSAYAAVYGTGPVPNTGVPSSDQPVVSPPSTAGIAVVFTDKEDFMKTLVARAKTNDGTVATAIKTALATPAITTALATGDATCSGAVLSAEDVFFGVRLDAKTQSKGWASICYRMEQYQFPKSETPDWPDSPGIKSEGEIRIGGDHSTTSNPDTTVLRMAPTIARWESHGWGFAPIPQEPMASSRANDSDTTHREIPEENRPLAVTHVFTVPADYLPLLPQFGETYKIRLRFVDIAGNSISASDTDETHAIGNGTEYLPYKRFEPIQPPFPLLWSALDLKHCPARQLTTLVVREGDAFDRRFIAPPRVQSYTLAKAHEKLLGHEIKAENPGAFLGAQLDDDGSFFSLKETGVDGREIENPIFLYQPANAEQPENPYLGDPAASSALVLLTDRRHFAFVRNSTATALLDELEAEIGVYYRDNHVWPNSQPFVLELHRSEFPNDHDVTPTATLSQDTAMAPFANVVRVDLLPGEKVLVKLASQLPSQSWTEALALFDSSVNDLAQVSGGELPAISPPLEITLIHAVKRPVSAELVSIETRITLPCLPGEQVLVREAGSKSASLTWNFNIHRSSVSRLDLKASWTEMTEANGVECHVEHHVLTLYHHKVDLDPANLQATPAQTWNLKEPEKVANIVQLFGDTHYRLVTYSARAVTRYREYFPAGGDENEYSVETNSITVRLPSTQAPDPPKIYSAVQVFEWSPSPDDKEAKVLTRKGILRIYLETGWYSSGDGECLAAVLLDPVVDPHKLSDDDLKKILTPVTTRWGMDPLWKTDSVTSFPAQSDFRDGVKPECSYSVPGLDKKSKYRFRVVAVSPVYDTERKLWRADFSISPQTSYMPFIRLALARYQKYSIEECELSPVVLAEFAQLLPDRTTSLCYAPGNDKLVYVTVQGVSYRSRRGTDGAEITEPVRICVCLQERAGDLDGDLGWHPVGQKQQSTQAGQKSEARQNGQKQGNGQQPGCWFDPDPGYPKLMSDSKTPKDSIGKHLEWRFSVSLPESRKERHYRVVVKENEIYPQEDQSKWPSFSYTRDFERTVFMSVLGV